MHELLAMALKRFIGSVNLLVADDDLHVLSAMKYTFSSPAFNLTMAESYDEAVALIGKGAPWHCWVLDIDLGENRTGIDILKGKPNFPFVLILSGLQSMRIAAEAVNLGAMAVFDKNPDFFQSIFNETCRTAALGYVLGGKQTQYLPVYRLLCTSIIQTPEEWAEKACVSLRQIQRICEVHPVTTPRATLSLFYTVYALLLKGREPFTNAMPTGMKEDDAGYIAKCIENTLLKS